MYSYDFSDYIGITVSGSDTEDWLNRILSNKVPNDKKYFGASVRVLMFRRYSFQMVYMTLLIH